MVMLWGMYKNCSFALAFKFVDLMLIFGMICNV